MAAATSIRLKRSELQRLASVVSGNDDVTGDAVAVAECGSVDGRRRSSRGDNDGVRGTVQWPSWLHADCSRSHGRYRASQV